MTIRQCEIFVAVLEYGSVSRAAKALCITQPSASQMLADLEREHSSLLFERFNKRLHPTETGRQFLAYAQQMISLQQEMHDFLRTSGARKHIRIGATITPGTCLLSTLTQALTARLPTIGIEVVVSNTAEIETRLRSGTLDVGLIEGQITAPDLCAVPAISDKLVFVCSHTHPLATAPPPPLSVLTHLPLLLRESGSGTRAQLTTLLHARGITPDIRWDCSSSEAILTAVASNQGVTVLSSRLAHAHVMRPLLWTSDFCDADLHRSFCVTYHKDKLVREEVQCFLQICLEYQAQQPAI